MKEGEKIKRNPRGKDDRGERALKETKEKPEITASREKEHFRVLSKSQLCPEKMQARAKGGCRVQRALLFFFFFFNTEETQYIKVEMETPTKREKVRIQERKKMSDAPKDGERVHSEPQRRVKPWTRWKALHIGWKQHSESTSAVSLLPSQGKRQQSHMRGPGKQDQ